MKEIEFYTTLDGKCPYIEWAMTLTKEYRARVDIRLKRMQNGNFGDCKRLQNSELSELRLNFGKGYRVYYKELDNVIVLIVAGSDKSNQKAVIKQADKYLNEYKNRSKNNGEY